MNETKFRAWDSKKNKMLSIGKFPLYHEKDNGLHCGKEDNVGDWYSLPLMQFTGLKDKNGKEIYFGDILSTSNSDINYDIWSKEENGYTVVLETKRELGVSYSEWEVEDDFLEYENRFEKNTIYSLGFVEVIGNIYENPELLNKQP